MWQPEKALCDVCQQLDFRELFVQTEAQPSTQLITRLDGLHDEEMEFKKGLPDFFRHQKSLSALEAAARLDCKLCTFIFDCWSGSSQRSARVDKAIDDAGQGQIFIGTSSHNVTKAEIPVLTVTQRPDGHSSRTLCTFDIFAERDSIPRKLSKYIVTPVSPHSEAEACKVTAMAWFQDCLTNHPECGPGRSFRRPTRLIDVGNMGENEPPRLKIDDISSTVSWAALSYCWGGDSTFTLRSDTIQDLKDGIPLGKWPATLRDAIKITQNLGLHYLWIDALCILQDSGSDWRAEAGRMRDVYSGAAITIIASESPSTSAGIHASRPPSPYGPCQVPFRMENKQYPVWLRPSIRNAIDTSYTDPLQTRGWTLQEGLLAPRTLSFHKDQMIWECSNYRLKESGHTILLDHLFDSKDLFHNKHRRSKTNLAYQNLYFGFCKQVSMFEYRKNRLGLLPKYITSSGMNMQDFLQVNPYTRWFEIVFEYSRRNFTKYSDVLPALGGIARAFADITKDKYCAGMWESELLQCLCWWRQGLLIDRKKLYEPSNMDFSRPTEYRAPSWSWAGINGSRVTMYNSTIDGTLPIINLATPIKIHLEPLDEDPFGQLKSGYLTIKGSLIPLGDLWAGYWRNLYPSWEMYKGISDNQDRGGGTGEYPALHGYTLQQLNRGAHQTFEFEQQHISHPDQKFAAFVIGHTEGIADEDTLNENEAMKGTAHLLCLETTDSTGNEYRRIGRIALTRPLDLAILAPEIYRIETKKWREIAEEEWRRFDGEIEKPATFDELEAKAWIEVTKRSPKRTTIRII